MKNMRECMAEERKKRKGQPSGKWRKEARIKCRRLLGYG